MKSTAFKQMVLEHLSTYKNEVLGISNNGMWKNNRFQYSHILPENLKELNFLPMTSPIEAVHTAPNISFHSGAHHLNSSQIMCINFFAPLLRDAEGLSILKEIIKKETLIKFTDEATIVKACFEYEPDEKEGTNFDFYMELSTGERILFEIKYTESGFGSIHKDKNNPNKYDDKWEKHYDQQTNKSLYLKGISKEDFYKNYQIWRNVSYIVNDSDYVVFLFSYLNNSHVQEIQKTVGFSKKQKYANVSSLCWYSFIRTALALTKDSKYYFHFHLFKEKYLKFTISVDEMTNLEKLY
ncbi:hypothetical protein [Acetobacterium sp.]|uniref:PGN_0703 family putative restriction endonuclease n=1 Tax=Acetobacterium sp. TaxID=1872094 RepID=UPI0035936F12